MSEYHDLPEPPDGWIVSTNIEMHIAYLYGEDDGRSLGLTPTILPDSTRWNVTGFARYDSPSPVFVEDVPLEAAIETATEVMEATIEGRTVDPVGTVARSVTLTDQDDTADDTDDAEVGTATDGQADLTAFTVEQDDT